MTSLVANSLSSSTLRFACLSAVLLFGHHALVTSTRSRRWDVPQSQSGTQVA
jgi:hypothetical protein